MSERLEPLLREATADDRRPPELSVVIPVYKSAEGLPELLRRLTEALEALASRWEVVLVDDASPDDSWRVLREQTEGDPRFVRIQLTGNHGQQRAVLCGLAHAKGEYVVTMDDDLQHRPEDIAVLVRAIRERDCDAVVARFAKKKHGLVRNAGTRLVKWVAYRAVGVPLDLDLTSFRVMRRDIAARVGEQRNPSPVVGYLLYGVTQAVENVEVTHDDRKFGRSTYPTSRLFEYLAQMVLDYSDFPLRMVGYLGFLVAFVSFALGAYYLVRYSLGLIGVTGWVTVVLLICLFSGLLMMSLGIIGVYLVRILRSINTAQMYVVRRIER